MRIQIGVLSVSCALGLIGLAEGQSAVEQASTTLSPETSVTVDAAAVVKALAGKTASSKSKLPDWNETIKGAKKIEGLFPLPREGWNHKY